VLASFKIPMERFRAKWTRFAEESAPIIVFWREYRGLKQAHRQPALAFAVM
jgi:hypothetical protein